MQLFHPLYLPPLKALWSLKMIKEGMHGNHKSFNKEKIKEHIESFNQCISYYRRSHAPNCRYLPSDVTIANMWKDFNVKNPTTTMCSYSAYRGIVSDDMNIVFYEIGWRTVQNLFSAKYSNWA